MVRDAGLMARQPLYYLRSILVTACLLGASLAFMALVGNLWLQLVNAVFLAFLFVQIGFIGHDTGHLQVFRSPRKNDATGLIVNLVLGVSPTWWIDKHNRHHSNPNQLLLDPDTFIPVLAFTEEQALSKRGFYRLVVRYQTWLYYPMLLLQGLGVRLASYQYLLHNRAKYARLEPLLMAVSLAIFAALPIYLLGVWHGLLFMLVHQFLYGLYQASVFAPNHKGMPILDEDTQMDFLRRQVVTARNIKPHPVTDFLYGGLNYQIEHHLFPNMPRNRLNRARTFVKDFCESHGVPYYETGVLRSQWEILSDLHRNSAPLRRRRA